MKILIESIIVPENRRKIDMEKVNQLAESIGELGLMNPITITKNNRLVAGLHRLEALKLRDEKEIEVSYFEGDDLRLELAEIDENLIRNELHYIDRADILLRRKMIYEMLHPLTKSGVAGAVVKHRKVHSAMATSAVAEPSFATDTSIKAGVAERTIREEVQLARDLIPEIKEIIRTVEIPKRDAVKIARLESEEQKAVADKLSSGEAKSFVDAKRLLAKENVYESVAIKIDSKYRIIYADPPWSYGNKLTASYGAAEHHYPTMSIAELCLLPVSEIIEENAVLFLWTTSPLLKECFEVIDAWGFRYKTSFVWDKVKHNMGHYNSVRHELLLVCTKGSCTPDVSKLFDSVVSIERSETHSEKPEFFREMIDTLYPYGKRIELFARKLTNGWESWGNQV
ncbi:MAG: ParB N-terminal domain-containing protein [Planctomycetaceae bacterium]|jgi:N6-adenosine-specific RNA methylase IME4|nr:ParB N-terminal domain-containing protein [Planctomycetaceae bacterium]